MAQERKQDLSDPDEEALEKHVREMLDVTVPDTDEPAVASSPDDTTPSAPEISKSKKTAIPVVAEGDQATPKVVPEDPELTAAIEEANKQLAAQQVASAPLVEPATKGKKLTITHFDDQPTPVDPQSAASAKNAPVDLSEETPAVTPEARQRDKGNEEIPDSPLEKEIESPETDKAVSDIIASESDVLLAVGNPAPAVRPSKPPKKRKGIFGFWSRHKGLRKMVVLSVVLLVAGLAAFPTSRYYILNELGVRGSASVLVMDQTTRQPLKNARITIDGKTAQTNQDGKAVVTELRLGPTELLIERRAFGELKRSITVGWGSNPLGEFSLQPQGDQYKISVTDMLSGGAIPDAEASVDDLSARADEKGVITLTMDDPEADIVKVSIKAAGYRDETLELNLNKKEMVVVKMTLSQKVVFVSKRSGKYDVYKVDVDGKDEKLLLAGTGNERDDIVLAQHPTDTFVALVSERNGKRSSKGVILQELLVVNINDGTTKAVAEASQLKVIDWIGTRVVYVRINDDAKPEDPQRYKLMSYDYRSGDNRQLASTNYFNDIVSVSGKIYYAPSSAYQNGVNVGVFAVMADGSGKKPILDKEAWNVYRTSYDEVTMAVQQDWYSYKITEEAPQKLDGQPSLTTSRVYSDSPDSKHSIWIDNRDGKGALIQYDTAARSEKLLQSQNGIKGPVRWLGNTVIVFRVVTDQETADYVMSTQGGEPKKLTNVTNTAGVDRWAL